MNCSPAVARSSKCTMHTHVMYPYCDVGKFLMRHKSPCYTLLIALYKCERDERDFWGTLMQDRSHPWDG